MERTSLPITEADIANSQPSSSNRKLYDARGLYLLIKTTGKKLWRLKYVYATVEQSVTLGAYPALSLDDARAMCNQHHNDIARGIDPALKRRATKQLDTSKLV
ncbi:MAG TPA: Arm DNA-binding domain-containing protein [Sulfuricurvum sp.]|nr:Arm DNA-binding domain-containing protein [Sulfuricurvum sp.]